MTQELRKLAEAVRDAKTYNELVLAQTKLDDSLTSRQLLELLDRLEKAEKDAARMDWLDKYAHVATWVDNEPTKLVIDAASGDEFTGDTWRDAIDSAMEASK